MKRAAVLIACTASTSAWAYESEEQDLLFSDDFDVYESLEYDSGWLPKGSPLAVRVYVESSGGALTQMEATSQLTWPESLSHQIHGVPGTGWFGLITDLDLGADVGIDLWGYTGTWDVWSTGLNLMDDTSFDPLLLADSTPNEVQVDSKGDNFQSYEIEVPIFAGVELAVIIDLYPQATATLQGVAIETDGHLLTSSSRAVVLDLPTDDPGVLPLSSSYIAWIEAALDLVVQPSLEVCAPILGCYEVASFDIPIPLASVQEERAFDPVHYSHPLPALDVPIGTHDFGEVEVGALANLDLPIGNIGQLDLYGELVIDGSTDFTVYPQAIYAARGGADGVVVSFAPSTNSGQTAVLVLRSNDPATPDLRIPLAGNGWVETDDEVDGTGASASISTCGCGTPASPSMLPLLGGLLGLLGLRRRRAYPPCHNKYAAPSVESDGSMKT